MFTSQLAFCAIVQMQLVQMQLVQMELNLWMTVQVGMRHFNIRKNKYHCPIVNLDKLWSLVGNEVCKGYVQEICRTPSVA